MIMDFRNVWYFAPFALHLFIGLSMWALSRVNKAADKDNE